MVLKECENKRICIKTSILFYCRLFYVVKIEFGGSFDTFSNEICDVVCIFFGTNTITCPKLVISNPKNKIKYAAKYGLISCEIVNTV